MLGKQALPETQDLAPPARLPEGEIAGPHRRHGLRLQTVFQPRHFLPDQVSVEDPHAGALDGVSERHDPPRSHGIGNAEESRGPLGDIALPPVRDPPVVASAGGSALGLASVDCLNEHGDLTRLGLSLDRVQRPEQLAQLGTTGLP